MKIKVKRVSTLVYIFFFSGCLFLPPFCSFVSSMGLPIHLKNSEVQENQDGGDASSKSENTLTETPVSSLVHKRNFARSQISFVARNPVAIQQVKSCRLSQEVLDQIPKRSESKWIVDDTVVKLLHNDLQELVQCTSPHEKIIFRHQEPVTLHKTMIITHELEFIGESRSQTRGSEFGILLPIFTCPMEGPVLSINTSHFVATELQIKNCTESAGKAAVIIESNSRAIFNRTSFKDNKSRGVYIDQEANVTIAGASFDRNEAKNGGAIYANDHSHVQVFNSVFKGNKAIKGDGGAIHLKGNGVCDVHESTLSNNTTQKGGLMYLCKASVLTIHESVFSYNSAQQNGGGIFVDTNNSINISASTFLNNSAHEDGGGVFMYMKNSLSIHGSSFSYNNAQFGGGVSVETDYSITLVESTFSSNSAMYGGGIFAMINNSFNMNRSTFSNSSAEYGGGVCASVSNSFALNMTNFSNNRAFQYGGGIYVSEKNVLTLSGSIFTNNTANENGGAIYARLENNCSMRNALLSRGLLENAALQRGGALYFYFNDLVTLVNSAFHDNIASYGGALHLRLDVEARILRSSFLSNHVIQHGTIYLGDDCNVFLERSNMTNNTATYGGCLYGYRSSLNVSYSSFVNNFSHKLGGCFYLTSSKANFQDTKLSLNNALEDGGAIYATTATNLHIRHSSIRLNNASHSGGGVALLLYSLFLCSKCTFESNTAKRGGGCYIESDVRQSVIVQMTSSRFEGNIASNYGGGMVVKVFGVKKNNCFDLNVACSRVLLLNSSFSNNFAHRFGAALVVTKLDGVLVSCAEAAQIYDQNFLSSEMLKLWIQEDDIKTLNSTKPCLSWRGNEVSFGVPGSVVGTFGRRLSIVVDSIYEHQLFGDIKSELVLPNVLSGRVLPNIVLTALDAFGNRLAPTLYDNDAVILDFDGSFQHPTSISFENGNCTIIGIVGFVQPGNYTIKFKPRNDDMLEATNLTLIVRSCQINEESTRNGTLCEKCGEASYNFDLSGGGKCALCPKEANCTQRFIFPTNGYWHKSPCHDKVKKCIVKEACSYSNRTQRLTNLSQNFTDCSLSNASLDEYEDAQCNEGYKGQLCGSCRKSFGLSSNLECLRCGHMMFSVARLLFVILWLLVTTIIAIKGTLPIASRCLVRSNAMTPTYEDDNCAPTEEGTSSQFEDIPQVTTNDEPQVPSSISPQLAHGITIANGNLVETWKILLNFLQINSTAVAMNVKWTSKILGFFEMLNLISAATLNAISRPIDCLVVSLSTGARAIWRYLFGLLVPMAVVVLLSMYWGYQSVVQRIAERQYFVRRFLLTMITVVYIIYFDVTQHVVKVFSCVVIYDNTNPFSTSFKRYWINDTSTECYKSTHVVLIAISIVFLIVVSIGFPITCSIALLRSKSELSVSNSRAHEILGLLYGPFKEKFVYWECITMLKKAMLSLIIVFSYSLGHQAQGLLISIVLVFFLTLHSACYPFKKEFNILNYYEIGSLMTSCITYTIVQFFNIERLSETERSLLSISLIVLNGGFVIFMLVVIARNLIMFAKASLRSYHIIENHDVGLFESIRIYFYARWHDRPSFMQN